MCFSKTLSSRLRTIIQVIRFPCSPLSQGGHIAPGDQKSSFGLPGQYGRRVTRVNCTCWHAWCLLKNKQVGNIMVPKYKIFVAFSLCTSQNKLKTKDKNSKKRQSRTMPENSWEIATHITKIAQFLKRGKTGHSAKTIAFATWSH